MMQDNAESLCSTAWTWCPRCRRSTPTLPGGTVVDQDPKSGAEVQPGATVTIYVSNAPVATTVKVPAVAALGLTEAQAKAKLALYGLKAKIIDLETPDYKPGLVHPPGPGRRGRRSRSAASWRSPSRGSRATTTTTERHHDHHDDHRPTTTTTTPYERAGAPAVGRERRPHDGMPAGW